MRRLVLPTVLLLAACHEAAPPAPPATSSQAATVPTPAVTSMPPAPKPSAIAELSARYLDGLFKAKPHLATFMGDHRFDAQLPDLSPEAVAKRDAELVELQAALAKADAATLDDKTDAAILKDAIGLELLYLREIKDWEWDPRLDDSFPYYDPREIVAGRLSDIVHGDFAPEADRKKSVTAQLTALPAFLANAQKSLAHPTGKRKTPKEYVEHAIKDNPGRIEFFETELKAFTKGDAAAEAARKTAVEALKRYQTFLEKELRPSATGEWRLGKELYAKKFPLALQTDRTPEDAVKAAEQSFAASRASLLEVAKSLHQKLWPGQALPTGAKSDAKIIGRVKEELSKKHPAPAKLVEAHAQNLDRMRDFIVKKDLLGLPPKETLSVAPMPAFKRGSTAAEYLAPGVLDRQPTWRATYYVDPIDPAWKPERVESYLRGQNDYEVELVAMHEAYPGHHTQYFYSKKNLDAVRAVLWNAAMVEGWAVYAEGQMVTAGWGDADNDRYRFYDLRGQMVAAANTILDVKLQSGTMTDAEAVRFMVEDGFQEQAMAEKKLLRAKLDSTQLAQYFLGLDEIRALERDYRAKVGSGFSQRTFNEGLVSHGSIAVKYLRGFVLGG